MNARTTSFGLALSLLLTAAAPCATAQAESACQSSKGKAKSRAGRPGRGASKSKAASQSQSAAPAASESESDESDDLSGLDDVVAPRQPEPPVSKPRVAAPAPERVQPPAAKPEPEPDEEASEPEASASDAEPEQTDAAPAPENATEDGERGPSVRIEAAAGFGIATRSVRMPSKDGALEVAPGVTPAAEVGLRVVVWPTADFSFFVNLIYQSALGFSVTERPPLALPKEVRARSERVALDIAPRWRFAGGRIDVAVPIGATVRTLWAEVHTSLTPSYSLVGPHARVELRLALGDMLSLRLGPELQYIMMVDRDLLTAGTASQGVALGGDASLDAQLSEVWSFRIAYREAHALLGAARGSVTFQDVERYLTLRAVGSF